jgi:hypothetical protein
MPMERAFAFAIPPKPFPAQPMDEFVAPAKKFFAPIGNSGLPKYGIDRQRTEIAAQIDAGSKPTKFPARFPAGSEFEDADPAAADLTRLLAISAI